MLLRNGRFFVIFFQEVSAKKEGITGFSAFSSLKAIHKTFHGHLCRWISISKLRRNLLWKDLCWICFQSGVSLLLSSSLTSSTTFCEDVSLEPNNESVNWINDTMFTISCMYNAYLFLSPVWRLFFFGHCLLSANLFTGTVEWCYGLWIGSN